MDRLSATIREMLVHIEAAIPYGRSELVALCYENGKVHEVDYRPENIYVVADVTRDLGGRLEEFVLNRTNRYYEQIESRGR